MEFTRMAFAPDKGLRSTTTYPATPQTEDEAREQIQGVIDQLRDYINNTLLPALASVTTGSSGADNIGSAAISGVESAPGVSAVTVYDQLVAIKAISDAAVAGALIPGCIDNANLFAAGVVALAAMAANSVDSDQYVDYSIDPEHLADDAVTRRAIADGAVGAAQIAAEAVTNPKIGAQAVGEGNIATGAVTVTKLGMGAVEVDKIKDGAVTDAKMTVQKVNRGGDTMSGNLTTPGFVLNAGDPRITFDKSKNYNGSDGTVADFVYYDESEGTWKLKVYGCTEVYLLPAVMGTAETPSGTSYPKGTVYFQYAEEE